MRGNLVSWTSENPNRVMTSSTEVECSTLTQLCKEIIWQRQTHTELKFVALSPVVVYEDNQASISLASSPATPHKRSKHFDIEFNMCKQCVESKEIVLRFCPTTEQCADVLTKPLGVVKFTYFRDSVMGGHHLQAHDFKGASRVCVLSTEKEEDTRIVAKMIFVDVNLMDFFSSSPLFCTTTPGHSPVWGGDFSLDDSAAARSTQAAIHAANTDFSGWDVQMNVPTSPPYEPRAYSVNVPEVDQQEIKTPHIVPNLGCAGVFIDCITAVTRVGNILNQFESIEVKQAMTDLITSMSNLMTQGPTFGERLGATDQMIAQMAEMKINLPVKIYELCNQQGVDTPRSYKTLLKRATKRLKEMKPMGASDSAWMKCSEMLKMDPDQIYVVYPKRSSQRSVLKCHSWICGNVVDLKGVQPYTPGGVERPVASCCERLYPKQILNRDLMAMKVFEEAKTIPHNSNEEPGDDTPVIRNRNVYYFYTTKSNLRKIVSRKIQRLFFNQKYYGDTRWILIKMSSKAGNTRVAIELSTADELYVKTNYELNIGIDAASTCYHILSVVTGTDYFKFKSKYVAEPAPMEDEQAQRAVEWISINM